MNCEKIAFGPAKHLKIVVIAYISRQRTISSLLDLRCQNVMNAEPIAPMCEAGRRNSGRYPSGAKVLFRAGLPTWKPPA